MFSRFLLVSINARGVFTAICVHIYRLSFLILRKVQDAMKFTFLPYFFKEKLFLLFLFFFRLLLNLLCLRWSLEAAIKPFANEFG